MVRFVVALLSLLVMTGCSTSMDNYQAGEKALYLFCTADRSNREVLDAFFEEDLSSLKQATATRVEIWTEKYKAFSDIEQWPESVRPEAKEFASLTLRGLDNLSRVSKAIGDSVTYEQAVLAIGATSREDDKAVTTRLNELSTAIRVKLNLSLDRESSCVGY